MADLNDPAVRYAEVSAAVQALNLPRALAGCLRALGRLVGANGVATVTNAELAVTISQEVGKPATSAMASNALLRLADLGHVIVEPLTQGAKAKLRTMSLNIGPWKMKDPTPEDFNRMEQGLADLGYPTHGMGFGKKPKAKLKETPSYDGPVETDPEKMSIVHRMALKKPKK